MVINFEKICLILLMFMLVGCGIEYDYDVDTINYNLNIGKTFNEKIIFTVDPNSNSLRDVIDGNGNETVVYQLFKTNIKFFPIFDNSDIKYRKKINKSNDKLEGVLEYNYTERQFDYSTFIMNCFEDYELVSYDDYFEASISGKFYCWNNQNVDINVTTDYDVYETNGEKINDKYMWSINADNYDDVDIYYKVSRNYSEQAKKARGNNIILDNVKYMVSMVVIIILMFYLYKFYKKKKVELDL